MLTYLPTNPTHSIVDLGLDSLDLSALASELGQKFDADIGLATMIHAESFTDLFDALLEAGSSSGVSSQGDPSDFDDDDSDDEDDEPTGALDTSPPA